MKNLYLALLTFFALGNIHAQQTGSFEEVVTFSEPDYNATRTLYYFVPTDYDENESYPLVVGFRGGPHVNAGQFRDQLTFLADSIGAIILCPENIDHFWNNEPLTKQLFQYSVQHISDTYNIAADFIYLTGLSFGGRHSVIVSMGTDSGPQASLRGVIPFAAGLESETIPNYPDSPNFPPACICIGNNDSNDFKQVSNELHDDIQANGGVSILNEIPNVGHTVDFPGYPDEMMECFNFINSQYEDPTTALWDEQADYVEMQVAPNPVSDVLSFSLPESFQPEQIIIVNQLGIQVRQLDAEQRSTDLSDLPTGNYIIIATAKNKVARKQIVVSR